LLTSCGLQSPTLRQPLLAVTGLVAAAPLAGSRAALRDLLILRRPLTGLRAVWRCGGRVARGVAALRRGSVVREQMCVCFRNSGGRPIYDLGLLAGSQLAHVAARQPAMSRVRFGRVLLLSCDDQRVPLASEKKSATRLKTSNV
jgi:hypothetical protein